MFYIVSNSQLQEGRRGGNREREQVAILEHSECHGALAPHTSTCAAPSPTSSMVPLFLHFFVQGRQALCSLWSSPNTGCRGVMHEAICHSVTCTMELRMQEAAGLPASAASPLFCAHRSFLILHYSIHYTYILYYRSYSRAVDSSILSFCSHCTS